MMKFDRNQSVFWGASLAAGAALLGAGALPAILRAQSAPKKLVPIDKKAAKPGAKTPAKTAPKAAPTKPAAKPAAPKNRTGDQVWKDMCASCHGDKGQGGKGYRRPLLGDMSIGELSQYIHEYMPPDANPKLSLDEARKVAEWIHGAFYSPLAQERLRPARVDLSRLTVRQYQNAVTDLVGSFRPTEKIEKERGLRGKYFKTRQGDDVVLDRVDGEINFDFKTEGAVKEQDDPYQFVMHWNGSVFAPDTGEYEFIVRTEHSARLWVNDLKTPLVDALVKSGNDNEYRETIFLQGGRYYPLRLEFYKGVRGVDNLKKLKEKPVQPASIALMWQMPKRADEVIPQRWLIPATVPEKFVPTTPFPPDDRSIGYERGNLVTPEWTEATTEGALETAAYVEEQLRDLSGVKEDAPDRKEKLKGFARKFVERAFRRPLTEDESKFFVDRQFEESPNLQVAIKRVVLLTLKSPRFLYREINAASPETPLDAYDVASRLSFALWDSLPDEELLKAASKNELSTAEQIEKQAQRMVGDTRAWSKMREFLLQWLKVDHYPDLAKNKKRYPDFDDHVASDLRTSLELTLEAVVWSEKSDFRELMLTDEFFLNDRLARIYGEELDKGAKFEKVEMNKGQRRGILTHPYLLSSFAYVDDTSPIHRGVLIARSVLGRALQPPPEAFTPLAADLHPKLTTRQRVALQTRPSACSSCHNLINPLGFTLEKFDATGKWRPDENGKPLDTSGSYISRSGQQVKFNDAGDLAKFLAGSEEVHAAFVEKLFQYMIKQPIRAYGPEVLSNLEEKFKKNEWNMRRQMVETAVLAAQQYPDKAAETREDKLAKPEKPVGKVEPTKIEGLTQS